MKNVWLVLVGLLVSACVSLPNKVQGIQEGDSKEKVVQVLGYPGKFGPFPSNPNYTVWQYWSGADICEVLLENDSVLKTGCGRNQNYVNPWGAGLANGLQGVGNGLQQPVRQPATVNCTSNNIGDTTYTNCR